MIGKYSGQFEDRCLGRTTKWPVKSGTRKGTVLYFLLGDQFHASGVNAFDRVEHGNWHNSPTLLLGVVHGNRTKQQARRTNG
jgi:hypothetical protein